MPATLEVQSPRYRQIVERAETAMRAELGETLYTDHLCRTCAVSERTLRSAFRAIYGVPPHRYLQLIRLMAARQALLSVNANRSSVTEIAMRFGFLELGRFSVKYRSTFGECPSDTLRLAETSGRKLSGGQHQPKNRRDVRPFTLESVIN